LRKNENGYYNQQEEINLHISIIKEIPEVEINTEKEISRHASFQINLKKISLLQSEEIISATKIAMFTQCQFKYQLTYELGFTSLFEKFQKWKRNEEFKKSHKIFEFSYKEELNEENSETTMHIFFSKDYAAIKGRVIHSILEKNLKISEIQEYIKLSLEREFDFLEKKQIKINELEKDIFQTIDKFYGSAIYNEIISYDEYKNEFEVYIFENNYYLYGIIDKIIFQEKKAIVIDYKTDKVKEENINERWNHYLNQLKFYAYLICKLKPQVVKVMLRLVFIEHPEILLQVEINRSEVLSFGKFIRESVDKIRKGEFKKNLMHCNNCVFSDERNNCIA
jgi:ATP-dependent helicase/nuclease subunit A